MVDGCHIGNKKPLYLRHRLTDRDEILQEYADAIDNRSESENLRRCICTNIAKGFEVCANGLIVV